MNAKRDRENWNEREELRLNKRRLKNRKKIGKLVLSKDVLRK